MVLMCSVSPIIKSGVTNSVSEVAEEFTKYYQMLYAKKKIHEAELRNVIRLMERKKY